MTLYRDGWYSKSDAEKMLAFYIEAHKVTPVCVSRERQGWEVIYNADKPVSSNHALALHWITAKELCSENVEV